MPQSPATALLLLFAAVLAGGCDGTSTQLERIEQRGELRVATRNGPTTYFTDRDGETGIEYEMARRFALDLGVRLRIMPARTPAEVIALVQSGRADIAAAGLPAEVLEQTGLAAGASYHWITHQLVYRSGARRPLSLDDLAPDALHVAAGTVPPARLEQLKRDHPGLLLHVHSILDTSDLLELLQAGHIPYLIVASNELAHARQIHPEIRAALNLTDPQPLVWGMNGDTDDRSLLGAVNAFKSGLERSGELGRLLDRFYGPMESFDYVDSRKFLERMDQRLPRYRDAIETAAEEAGVDWRLLAAIAYQESHWDPAARSPTGVRGMMMLTTATAKRMGVKNRLDPLESLRGGARYLLELKSRIPERIPEPDRTWLALAAYNVGLGHLEDARVITQRLGGDPDRWEDVRERLPLLGNRQWYKDTRHGYARGYEPVKFVRRIRRYYNVLLQLNQPQPEQQLVELTPIEWPLP